MRSSILVATLAVVVTAGACSSKKEAPPPPRTPEQQRTIDSTIGASQLPGAQGVNRALVVQDSAKARQARMDSMMKAEAVPPGA